MRVAYNIYILVYSYLTFTIVSLVTRKLQVFMMMIMMSLRTQFMNLLVSVEVFTLARRFIG